MSVVAFASIDIEKVTTEERQSTGSFCDICVSKLQTTTEVEADFSIHSSSIESTEKLIEYIDFLASVTISQSPEFNNTGLASRTVFETLPDNAVDGKYPFNEDEKVNITDYSVSPVDTVLKLLVTAHLTAKVNPLTSMSETLRNLTVKTLSENSYLKDVLVEYVQQDQVGEEAGIDTSFTVSQLHDPSDVYEFINNFEDVTLDDSNLSNDLLTRSD